MLISNANIRINCQSKLFLEIISSSHYFIMIHRRTASVYHYLPYSFDSSYRLSMLYKKKKNFKESFHPTVIEVQQQTTDIKKFLTIFLEQNHMSNWMPEIHWNTENSKGNLSNDWISVCYYELFKIKNHFTILKIYKFKDAQPQSAFHIKLCLLTSCFCTSTLPLPSSLFTVEYTIHWQFSQLN